VPIGRGSRRWGNEKLLAGNSRRPARTSEFPGGVQGPEEAVGADGPGNLELFNHPLSGRSPGGIGQEEAGDSTEASPGSRSWVETSGVVFCSEPDDGAGSTDDASPLSVEPCPWMDVSSGASYSSSDDGAVAVRGGREASTGPS
jgi:hypothetical protein